MPRGRREVNPKIQVKGEEEEEGERRERERGTRPLPTEVKDLPPEVHSELISLRQSDSHKDIETATKLS